MAQPKRPDRPQAQAFPGKGQRNIHRRDHIRDPEWGAGYRILRKEPYKDERTFTVSDKDPIFTQIDGSCGLWWYWVEGEDGVGEETTAMTFDEVIDDNAV